MRAAILLGLTMVVLAAGAAAVDGPSATAVVCTGVKDRVAQGASTTFPASVGQLTCLSEVHGVKDSVAHVWLHGGKEVGRMSLPVKAERWRTWSTKKILPAMTGAWKVEVRDAAGAVLAAADFTVQ
jgi:hypothetical protein